MSLNPKEPDLKDLDSRLKAAKRTFEEKQKPPKAGSGKAISIALQMAIEFVLAVILGSGLGWGLDIWLDTKPWFLIIFFFIGSAAGIKNVFRAADSMKVVEEKRIEENETDK